MSIDQQIPILTYLKQWFHKKSTVIDSFVFNLNYRVNAFLIAVGILWIDKYNLGEDSITCYTKFDDPNKIRFAKYVIKL